MARTPTRAAESRSEDEPESVEAEAERWAAWQRWEHFVSLTAPIDLEPEPASDAEGK